VEVIGLPEAISLPAAIDLRSTEAEAVVLDKAATNTAVCFLFSLFFKPALFT
jgi:hypothetical protein